MGKVDGLCRSQVNTSEEGFGKGERRNRLREISRLLSVVVALGEGDILIEGRTEGKISKTERIPKFVQRRKCSVPVRATIKMGTIFFLSFFSDHVFFRARSSGHPQPAWDLEC